MPLMQFGNITNVLEENQHVIPGFDNGVILENENVWTIYNFVTCVTEWYNCKHRNNRSVGIVTYKTVNGCERTTWHCKLETNLIC